MALTAARSDLTISVVGEDETQKMLADAQANMSALEGKIKSLQRTGQAQAATASKQSSALGGLNSKMAGAAKGAEGLFEGFDKVKGVFEKASSAAMFFAPVIAGVATAVVGAISALVGLNAGLSAHEEALFRAAGAARSYADAMAAAAVQADAARDSARKAATDISTLNLKIAEASGDKAAIAAAKAEKVFADSADARIAKGAEFTKALKDEAQAQADVDKALSGMARARADIAAVDAEMSHRRRKAIDFENEALQLEKITLQQTFDSFDDASFDAGKRLVAMSEQVDALEVVLDRLDALDEAQAGKGADPAATTTGKKDPPKPPTGPRRAVKTFEDELADIRAANKDLREAQGLLWDDSLREAREREAERLKVIADALKAEEAARKAAAEQARQMRLDETQPVYDFADALTSSLVPALGEVGTVMSAITAQFDKFREGQASLTEALAGGATEIAAFAAKSIGGVKAEAAVRAVYEGAMGFATLATPVISAGHFTAAAMLTGVATGVIGSGSGGGGEKKRGIPRAENTQQGRNEDGGGMKTVVINTMFGDRQSIAAGIRQADRSTRGTGYTRGVGV